MNKALKKVLAVAVLLLGEEVIRRGINSPPKKYSLEWIQGLTDREWEKEREIVRQNSCNSNLPFSEIVRWEKLRDLFDKVKSDRDWAGKTPQGSAVHREHGWYLPNDD